MGCKKDNPTSVDVLMKFKTSKIRIRISSTIKKAYCLQQSVWNGNSIRKTIT